jgi:hypothetical protein
MPLTGDILRAGLAAQSATLALSNLEGMNKPINFSKKKKLKRPVKSGKPAGIVKKGVTNIVGISLIRAQAGLISGL